MVDVRGDVFRPPHGTTPAAVKSNKISNEYGISSPPYIESKWNLHWWEAKPLTL